MAQNPYGLIKGTKLAYGDVGATPTYEDLSGIQSIDSLPQLAYDETETTLADQADDVKQFAPTFADPGNAEFTLPFDRSKLADIFALAGKIKAWKITVADGGVTQSTLTFDGWVKNVGPKIVDNKVCIGLSIRVSGAITPTAGT